MISFFLCVGFLNLSAVQDMWPILYLFFLSLPNDMFYWFERERERDRERNRETYMWERNMDQLPLTYTLTGDQTHNLGICPHWEWNWQLFGILNNTPTKWVTWPGPILYFLRGFALSLITSFCHFSEQCTFVCMAKPWSCWLCTGINILNVTFCIISHRPRNKWKNSLQ